LKLLEQATRFVEHLGRINGSKDFQVHLSAAFHLEVGSSRMNRRVALSHGVHDVVAFDAVLGFDRARLRNSLSITSRNSLDDHRTRIATGKERNIFATKMKCV
jgi:hypothetical protein